MDFATALTDTIESMEFAQYVLETWLLAFIQEFVSALLPPT
jgi:hypothetical protein